MNQASLTALMIITIHTLTNNKKTHEYTISNRLRNAFRKNQSCLLSLGWRSKDQRERVKEVQGQDISGSTDKEREYVLT